MSAAFAVQSLTQFARDVEDGFDADPNVGDNAEALAIVLAAIRDCRADLAKVYSKVETMLLAVAGERRFVVEGMGEVVVHKDTKRNAWQWDDMVSAVVSRVMDEPGMTFDPETGEQLPYVTIGHNVARRLRECIGFRDGKVTGLRAIGLQPDEFCQETPDGYSVELPPREVGP